MPKHTAITISIEKLKANTKAENLTFPKLCNLILETNGEETPQAAVWKYNANKKLKLLEYMRAFADIEEYRLPNKQNTLFKIKATYDNPVKGGEDKIIFHYEPYFSHLITDILQLEAAAGRKVMLKNYNNLTTGLGYLNEDYNRLRQNYYEFLEMEELLPMQKQFLRLFPLLSKTVSMRLQTLVAKEREKPLIAGVTINKNNLCYTESGNPQKLDEQSTKIFMDNYLSPALLKTNNFTALAFKIANRELSNERIIRELSKLRDTVGNTPFIYYGYEFIIQDDFTIGRKKATYIEYCKRELNNNIILKFLHDTGYKPLLNYYNKNGAGNLSTELLKYPIITENETPTKEEIKQYLTTIENTISCCRIEK